MTEQQAKGIQDSFYELTKKHLEDAGLEDNYGIGTVQAIRYSEGRELNTQLSFTWGGDKGLHGKIWLEMAQGLFNLGIQVINSIAKTEKVAIETTMDLFSLAMKTAHEEAKNNQAPEVE